MTTKGLSMVSIASSVLFLDPGYMRDLHIIGDQFQMIGIPINQQKYAFTTTFITHTNAITMNNDIFAQRL